MKAQEARKLAEAAKVRMSHDWTIIQRIIEGAATKGNTYVFLNPSSVPKPVADELRKDGYEVSYTNDSGGYQAKVSW